MPIKFEYLVGFGENLFQLIRNHFNFCSRKTRKQYFKTILLQLKGARYKTMAKLECRICCFSQLKINVTRTHSCMSGANLYRLQIFHQNLPNFMTSSVSWYSTKVFSFGLGTVDAFLKRTRQTSPTDKTFDFLGWKLAPSNFQSSNEMLMLLLDGRVSSNKTTKNF